MKFKIDFKNIPNVLLKEREGNLVLTLDIPSLTGRKRFYFQDGDEIEATDQLMEIALEGYECPKLPVTRVSKTQKNEYKKDLEKLGGNSEMLHGPIPEQVFYEVSEVRGKKPFSKVK